MLSGTDSQVAVFYGLRTIIPANSPLFFFSTYLEWKSGVVLLTYQVVCICRLMPVPDDTGSMKYAVIHVENSAMQQTAVYQSMSKFEQFRLSLEKEGRELEGDHDVALLPEKVQLKPPSMYQVIILNDDFTPMDFVVEVLEVFFNMSAEQATQIMLKVHTQGKAICGTFSKDVAETKASQVNEYSREFQHPLLCKTVKAD